MAENSGKKKPVGKMIFYGVLSAALYGALFANQALVSAYCAKGAWYAALPITAAFAFSFVHGHFTGYFWSVLGIEATKKALQPKAEVGRPDTRERPQPRPRLRARV